MTGGVNHNNILLRLAAVIRDGRVFCAGKPTHCNIVILLLLLYRIDYRIILICTSETTTITDPLRLRYILLLLLLLLLGTYTYYDIMICDCTYRYHRWSSVDLPLLVL